MGSSENPSPSRGTEDVTEPDSAPTVVACSVVRGAMLRSMDSPGLLFLRVVKYRQRNLQTFTSVSSHIAFKSV